MRICSWTRGCPRMVRHDGRSCVFGSSTSSSSARSPGCGWPAGRAHGRKPRSLLLRHQLGVLQRQQVRRPRLTWADRALIAALAGVIPKARRAGLRLLVRPDTVLRWHCDLLRRRWAAKSREGRHPSRRCDRATPGRAGDPGSTPRRRPRTGPRGRRAPAPAAARSVSRTPPPAEPPAGRVRRRPARPPAPP